MILVQCSSKGHYHSKIQYSQYMLGRKDHISQSTWVRWVEPIPDLGDERMIQEWPIRVLYVSLATWVRSGMGIWSMHKIKTRANKNSELSQMRDARDHISLRLSGAISIIRRIETDLEWTNFILRRNNNSYRRNINLRDGETKTGKERGGGRRETKYW